MGQAIFIDDILAVLKAAVLNQDMIGQTFDAVNGETLTYEMLLRQTAAALGKKRSMRSVPIASTSFSKRWVQLFSGASFELVSPLIDSLQCDLPQVSPSPTIARFIRFPTFVSMLSETLRRSPTALPSRVIAARQPKNSALDSTLARDAGRRQQVHLERVHRLVAAFLSRSDPRASFSR